MSVPPCAMGLDLLALPSWERGAERRLAENFRELSPTIERGRVHLGDDASKKIATGEHAQQSSVVSDDRQAADPIGEHSSGGLADVVVRRSDGGGCHHGRADEVGG